MYYEYNNELLDWVFHEKSNLKCALYADIHTAEEKTNFGGQQLKPPPEPLVYIQNSSGYSSKSLTDPEVPEGYELVFGPVDGANNAPGVRFDHDFIKNMIPLAQFRFRSTWVSLSLTGTT